MAIKRIVLCLGVAAVLPCAAEGATKATKTRCGPKPGLERFVAGFEGAMVAVVERTVRRVMAPFVRPFAYRNAKTVLQQILVDLASDKSRALEKRFEYRDGALEGVHALLHERLLRSLPRFFHPTVPHRLITYRRLMPELNQAVVDTAEALTTALKEAPGLPKGFQADFSKSQNLAGERAGRLVQLGAFTLSLDGATLLAKEQEKGLMLGKDTKDQLRTLYLGAAGSIGQALSELGKFLEVVSEELRQSHKPGGGVGHEHLLVMEDALLTASSLHQQVSVVRQQVRQISVFVPKVCSFLEQGTTEAASDAVRDLRERASRFGEQATAFNEQLDSIDPSK